MNDRQKAATGWIVFGLITISMSAYAVYTLDDRGGELTLYDVLETLVFWLQAITFALVGALIISRRPGNVIGLLLMLVGLYFVVPVVPYIESYAAAPAEPTLLLYGALWFSSWGWLLMIMPILFILVLFPTGKPFTPRWRWLIYFGLGLSLIMILLSTFGPEFEFGEGGLVVANPIGFLSGGQSENYYGIFLTGSLLLLTISCPSALFVRYRRTGAVERQQIKWLFYTGLLFAVSFIGAILSDAFTSDSLWDILFPLSVLAIPVAIGIAILRYRLFDIDVIIRKTLQYGLLTIALVAIYFGIVPATQAAFVALTGQESPIAVVISTLVIAALFNPLRQRLQAFIDRRFYRSKYNAAQALAHFSQVARDEVDLGSILEALNATAQDTLQPEIVTIWLRETEGTHER